MTDFEKSTQPRVAVLRKSSITILFSKFGLKPAKGRYMKRTSYSLRVSALIALCIGACLQVKQSSAGPIPAKSDYIEGAVASAKGPEAGVWVIAETNDLPTKYAKVVVTDDRGRYVLPELPEANYKVWVRGYGLVDSTPVMAKPGQKLDLKAVIAPDGKAAAQYYPANYWLALAKVPPGKQPPDELAGRVKGCLVCHQIGDPATRTLPPATMKLGDFKNSLEAWDRRTKSGPAGASMTTTYNTLGPQRSIFSDWTDRVAAGEYPKEAPPRPKGIERNLVMTLWDWGTTSSYMHDEAASDLRNPTVNPNGLVFGVVASSNTIAVLDPVKNTSTLITIPSNAEPAGEMNMPSPYWGDENIWLSTAQPRSSAIDDKGRVWYSMRTRGGPNVRDGGKQPDFCKVGSSNKFAQYFPIEKSSKQVGFYDPQTKQLSQIDTCFTTDHNEFGEDGSLFFGMTGAVGWVDSKMWDKTHNSEQSQGWLPGVLDTNGDGKITKPWTEPNEPIDPTKDHRINFACYSISVSPLDGSAWCSGTGIDEHSLVRVERGSNPPETSHTEIYQPPLGKNPEAFSTGGVSIDSNGVAWQNWRGSDYITAFDRRKCKVLNGPTATGMHCPEGWTFYETPGPTFQGGTGVRTSLNYLIFVDRHGILGLGKDVPMTGAVNADAVLAVIPKTGEFVTIRLPYPMGYFPRSMQGRIDDPKTGWKGRGFWTSYNSYTPWHLEGGMGTKDKVVKIQMRPDPLAK
jgi:hypothetical protein